MNMAQRIALINEREAFERERLLLNFDKLWKQLRMWYFDPKKRKQMKQYKMYEGPEHLCYLFNVSNVAQVNFEVVEPLLGPHGWTVYKALQIKRDNECNQDLTFTT
jgi:hypothetical protein